MWWTSILDTQLMYTIWALWLSSVIFFLLLVTTVSILQAAWSQGQGPETTLKPLDTFVDLKSSDGGEKWGEKFTLPVTWQVGYHIAYIQFFQIFVSD